MISTCTLFLNSSLVTCLWLYWTYYSDVVIYSTYRRGDGARVLLLMEEIHPNQSTLDVSAVMERVIQDVADKIKEWDTKTHEVGRSGCYPTLCLF